MDDAISRSAMLQDLDAWRNQLGIYTGDDPHELELWETVGTMLVQFSDNVSSAAPALNVAPVVHARWIYTMYPTIWYGDGSPPEYVCSNCTDRAYDTSLFCPNCGARMDGK